MSEADVQRSHDRHRKTAETGPGTARRELGWNRLKRTFDDGRTTGLFDLAGAAPPTFTLVPEREMYDALEQDHAAMTGMISGLAPSFEPVTESIAKLERQENQTQSENLAEPSRLLL